MLFPSIKFKFANWYVVYGRDEHNYFQTVLAIRLWLIFASLVFFGQFCGIDGNEAHLSSKLRVLWLRSICQLTKFVSTIIPSFPLKFLLLRTCCLENHPSRGVLLSYFIVSFLVLVYILLGLYIYILYVKYCKLRRIQQNWVRAGLARGQSNPETLQENLF